jgi:hypothetical protein
MAFSLPLLNHMFRDLCYPLDARASVRSQPCPVAFSFLIASSFSVYVCNYPLFADIYIEIFDLFNIISLSSFWSFRNSALLIEFIQGGGSKE